MWGGIPTAHGPCSYFYSPYHHVKDCPTTGQFSNYSYEHMNTLFSRPRNDLTPIPMTQDGATSLISRGKLKLLKILLHNFMNCTIRQIRNLMINHILLNIKQLRRSSLRLYHLLN
jgi:hypothetical protein